MPLLPSKVGSVLPRTLPSPLCPAQPRRALLDSDEATAGGFAASEHETTQDVTSSEDVANLEVTVESERGASVEEVLDAEGEVY